MQRSSESKLTADLESLVQNVDARELVDVVVELDTRQGIDDGALEEWFSAVATSVADQIAALGGQVTGTAWINQTLKARLQAERVAELSQLDEIEVVDVPHKITLD
jgi:hypothetical protein